MKSWFIFYCLLFTFSQSFSQLPPRSSGSVSTGSNVSVFDNNRFSEYTFDSRNKVLKYENIEGSPYINNNSGANNNLPIGKFYSTDFEYISTALARYNAYTDDMEVSMLEDGVDYYLLKKQEDFFYIILKKKTYRAYRHKNKLGFYVILSKDDKSKCTLLKKERIVFKKAEKPQNSFETSKPESFKKVRDTYYFKFENRLIEIPKKRKAFYGLFSENKDEMKRHIEANRLKMNSEKDLLKIAAHYNTLFN